MASGSASRRARQGSGRIASAAASSPASWAQAGAAGTVCTAPGMPASRARKASSPCTAMAPSDHSGEARLPSRASGVTPSVTTGMATRLASRPTSETCWKKTSVSGVRPSVATTWVRSPARAAASSRANRLGRAVAASPSSTSMAGRAIVDASRRPTAAKESQKPGCVRAQGSSRVTTTAAARSTSGQGQRRPAPCSRQTAASIQIVRCAGTPQPEKTA